MLIERAINIYHNKMDYFFLIQPLRNKTRTRSKAINMMEFLLISPFLYSMFDFDSITQNNNNPPTTQNKIVKAATYFLGNNINQTSQPIMPSLVTRQVGELGRLLG